MLTLRSLPLARTIAGLMGIAAVAGGQATSADSARVLAARAESAADQGTAESLQRALVLRLQADAIFARLGDTKNHGTQLNRIGTIHYLSGRLDSAITWYRRAADVRLAALDSSGYGATLQNIGNVFGVQGKSDSAIAFTRQALVIARAIHSRADESGPLSNLGLQFYQIGQLDTALAYLRDGLAVNRETGDKRGEGETLLTIGSIYHMRGQQDSAMREMRFALRLGEQSGDHEMHSSALTNIGNIFLAIGEPDSALTNYHAAIAENRARGDPGGDDGKLLHNVGMALGQLAQYDSALVWLHAARDAQHKVGDPREEGRALMVIGEVWYILGRPDSALAYFGQALPLRRGSSDRAGEGTLLGSMARALAAAGQVDSAIATARAAVAILVEVKDRRGEVYARGALGEVHERRGEPDAALVAYREMLAIARENEDRTGEAEALANAGHLLLNSNRFAAADAYFDSAAAAKARVSRRAGGDFNRVSLAEGEGALFDNWVRSWLHRRTGMGAADATLAALAAHEQGSAQALLDLMRDSSLAPRRARTLAAEGASLVAAGTRNGAAVLSYALVGDSLLIWTARSGAAVRLDIVPVTRDRIVDLVTQFRRSLGADEIAVVAASTPPARDTAAARDPSRFRGLPAAPSGNWRSAGRAISRVLLPPPVVRQLGGAAQIVVVPHGVLALVPFAALPLGTGDTLLGQNVAIQYVPSLGTYRALVSSPKTAAVAGKISALVVGNPTMPEKVPGAELRGVLSSLPGAEREAAAVARILRVAPLSGPVATEAEVRKRLPSADVVHLATHGIAYSSRALARTSFVALAPGDGSDGVLSVGEILDDPTLRLRADLVVLSACQTGLGTPSEAEGTIGFQRAFLARGARGVLVSLWRVSDAATERLMQRFYVYWRGTTGPARSAAEALRLAQNDVRREAQWQHPRFWAAFQLVGAPR